MVKVLIIGIVVFVAFAIVSQKYKDNETKPQGYKVLYVAHIVFGVLFSVVAAVHGVLHIQSAPVWMIATGATALALLFAEIVIGLILQKNKNKTLKIFHAVLPIVIVLVTAAHLIIAKFFI